IDVERIKFDPAKDTLGPFRSEQRGAAAQKATDDDVAAVRAIKQRVHHQLNRLDRRMQLQHVIALTRLSTGAVILPHIGAVAAVLAELDIVGVSPGAGLEDTDQFVLRSIERSHASRALDPNHDVLEFGIDLPTGGEEFVKVLPIHAHEMDRAAFAVLLKEGTAAGQK